MTDLEKQLIREFFEASARLLDAKIVRSDKLLGDIGEWLCVKHYGLVLEKSRRNQSYDGWIRGLQVQVKVHNSPEGTNINVGDPEKYDELIVILGPKSWLRVSKTSQTFHVYRFSSKEVQTSMKRNSGYYYCAKKSLNNRPLTFITL
ncbi:MAG: hypothetical protein HQM09_21970 [Candidatus Riflebacteria bacterium]|nr:hypothetical protein [Candidatus Riflebacteria bacterium]